MDEQVNEKSGSKELRFFRLTFDLINSLKLSSLTAMMLKSIEFLQISSLIMRVTLEKSWGDNQIFKYIFKAANYGALVFDDDSSDMVLLILMLIINLFVILTSLALCATGSVKASNNTSFTKIITKVLTILYILMQTVLFIPFCLLCFRTFSRDSEPPYMGAMAGLSIFLIFMIQVLIIICFTDPNPFSVYIFAGESKVKKSLFILFKIIPCVYSVMDREENLVKPYIIFHTIMCALFSLGLQANFGRSYVCRKLSSFCLWLHYSSFWLSLFCLLSIFTSLPIESCIYLVIMILLSFPFLEKLNAYKINSTLTQNFILFASQREIVYHILALIWIVDSLHNRDSRILIEGYISHHKRVCTVPGSKCYCKIMPCRTQLSLNQKKAVYYTFLVDLLRSSLARIVQVKIIHRLISDIYEHRLKNRFQAIYEITKMLEESTLLDRLQYHNAIVVIENEMIEYDIKQNVNAAVDLNKFLKFNIKIVEFEEKIAQCTDDHIEFWKEIMETNINLIKVEKFGSLISNQKEKVKEFFDQMLEINANNAHVYRLYGEFLVRVSNEDAHTVRYIDKANVIIKNLGESTKLNSKVDKYGDNSRTAIIILSGNEHELGTIVQTNNYINQAVGYVREELIGQNISTLMPKVFAQHHNDVLSRYLTTSDERMNGKERVVPVLCKNGFMFPASAYTKALPNLQSGIQIVGFLSVVEVPVEDEDVRDEISYILYNCQNEVIMGISQTCYTSYDIPKCLVYGDPNNNMNELKIKHIFGCNFEKEDEEGLMNGREFQAEIDTRRLENEFIIINSTSSKEIIPNSFKNIEKGSVCKVVVSSLLHLVYNNTPLRIVSFFNCENVGREKSQASSNRLEFENENKFESKSDSKSQSSELKDLKEFKNFISIKREPKAIHFIDCFCVILLVLFTFGLVGFIVQEERFIEYNQKVIEANKNAYLNRMLSTEIMFNIEKIFINFNDKYSAYTPKFVTADVEASLSELIKRARQNQIRLYPLKALLEVKEVWSDEYDIDPAGGLRKKTKLIDETISVWMSKIYNVIESRHSYLSNDPLNYSSVTNQMYIEAKYSEVFSLIDQNIVCQENIISVEEEKNTSFVVYIFIESGCLFLIAIVWLIIAMPKTLEVTQINARVLSLVILSLFQFSLISSSEVTLIIKKCQLFKHDFLDYSHSDEPEIVYTNKIKEFEEPITGAKQSNSLTSSCRLIINKEERDKPQMRNSQIPSSGPLNADNSQKMVNGNSNQKYMVWAVFLIIFFFLVGYICFNIGILIAESKNIKSEIKTIQTIYQRSSNFQELKLLFVEYLMDPEMTVLGRSMRKMNVEKISSFYESERSLVGENFSEEYATKIKDLDTKNICDMIGNFKESIIWPFQVLTYSQCASVHEGILKKGLKTSIVTALEEIRGRTLQTLTDLQSQDLNLILSSAFTEYEILEKYIQSPLLMIQQSITRTIEEYFQKMRIIFFLINSFFIVFAMMFWKLGWKRYINSLNQNVWNTKGMLNIIPTKIITSNEILMNEFTSGNLEKVVL